MKKLKIDPIFKEVLKINLLYINSSGSGKIGKEDSSRIISPKYILSSLCLLLVYGTLFFKFNFEETPYVFDILILALVFMNVLQTFTFYYNIFYESNDVNLYMTLPIKENTVFYAKLCSIIIATCQMMIPILVLIIFFNCRILNNNIIAILLAIVDFILIFGIVIALNAVIMNLLGKMSLITKFNKKIVNIISVLTMISFVGFIIIINFLSNKYVYTNANTVKVIYGPLSYLFSTVPKHIISVIGITIIVYILYKLSLEKLSKHFYEYNALLNDNRASVNKKANKKVKAEKYNKKSIFKILFNYNKSLLADTTVITQTMYSLLMPMFFIIPQLSIGKNIINREDYLQGITIAIIIGIFFGLLSTFSNSNIASVIISLDGGNYEFIKSLPISEKKYILNKYFFANILNIFCSLIILVLLNFFICKLGIMAMILEILFLIIISSQVSFRWIIYDYNNLKTETQNKMELYSRIDKGVFFAYYFFMIIIVIGMLLGTIFLISNEKFAILYFLIALITIGSLALTLNKAIKFVRKLEN